MPIQNAAAHFYAQLSTELKARNLDPEQVTGIAAAVASLPSDARLTLNEIDSIARSYSFSEQHKAALIVTLLAHRYPELEPHFKDQNAWAEGLGGVLDTLLGVADVENDEDQAVSKALDKFFVAFAGDRASVADSGKEVFVQAPSITVDSGSKSVAVAITGRAWTSLSDEMLEHLKVDRDAIETQSYESSPYGTFSTNGNEASAWTFHPVEGEEKIDRIPLARFGVQALEHLRQGLSTFILTPRHDDPDRATDEEAMGVADELVVARSLLVEVRRLLDAKNGELFSERSTRETELREALGEYRVVDISREQVNALVGALFGNQGKKKRATVKVQE